VSSLSAIYIFKDITDETVWKIPAYMEENSKTGFGEIVYGDVNWTEMIPNRIQSWVFVMKVQVPKDKGII